MKKRVTKLAVIALVVGGGIFANTQKVQANIFPHTEVGPCIDGYADVFEMGWGLAPSGRTPTWHSAASQGSSPNSWNEVIVRK